MPHLHESKIEFLEKMAGNTGSKSAQDVQDDIFRNMSADRKIEVAAGLWLLARTLNPKKIDFRIHGRDRPAPSAH